MDVDTEIRIIRAVAGAGKTTQLCLLINDLISDDRVSTDDFKIAVSTFTNAATNEIKKRIGQLGDDIRNPMRPENQGIQSDRDSLSTEYFHYLKKKYKRLQLIESGNIFVGTLHSVFLQVLNQNLSFFNRIEPYRVDPGKIRSEERFIFSYFDSNTTRKERRNHFLKKMYWTDLVSIFTDLLFEKIFGEKIVIHDWKSELEANREEFGRCIELLKRGLDDFQHSLEKKISGARNIEEKINWILEIRRIFDLDFFSIEQLEAFKAIFFRKRNLASISGAKETYELALEMLKLLKEEERLKSFFSIFTLVSQEVEEVFPLWISYKYQETFLSYDEVELLLLHFLNQNLEKPISGLFDYWFFDEYQDISPIQMQIIEKLIEKKKSFFVGDLQQSIYYFRGSRPQWMEERLSILEKNQGSSLLDINYRSNAKVLSWINYYFKLIPQKFVPLKAYQKKVSSYNIKTCVHIWARKTKEIAHSLRTRDSLQDNSEIQDFVYKLISSPIFKEAQGLGLSMGILAHQWEDLSIIHYFLKKEGIQVKLEKPAFLTEIYEIKILFLLFRFLVNPKKNEFFMEFFLSPLFIEIHSIIINLLDHYKNKTKGDGKNLSLCSFTIFYLDQSKVSDTEIIQESKVFSLFRYILLNTHLCLEEGLLDLTIKLWQKIINELGLQNKCLWENSCIFFETTRSYLEAGWTIFEILEFWSRAFFEGIGQIKAFGGDSPAVESFLSVPSDTKESRVPLIRLMTIHASKGLEFDLVTIYEPLKKGKGRQEKRPFIVDSSKKERTLIPRVSDLLDAPPQLISWRKEKVRSSLYEAEELGRLLYVAFTRAREVLIIFISPDFENLEIEGKNPSEVKFSTGGAISDFQITYNQEDLLRLYEQAFFYDHEVVEWLDNSANKGLNQSENLDQALLFEDESPSNFSKEKKTLELVPTLSDPQQGKYTLRDTSVCSDGKVVSLHKNIIFNMTSGNPPELLFHPISKNFCPNALVDSMTSSNQGINSVWSNDKGRLAFDKEYYFSGQFRNVLNGIEIHAQLERAFKYHQFGQSFPYPWVLEILEKRNPYFRTKGFVEDSFLFLDEAGRKNSFRLDFWSFNEEKNEVMIVDYKLSKKSKDSGYKQLNEYMNFIYNYIIKSSRSYFTKYKGDYINFRLILFFIEDKEFYEWCYTESEIATTL